MKVFVKNKLFSLTGASKVIDENKEGVYKVKGKLKLFSPTRKKKIYDMEGNLLYIVRNKFWSFFKRRALIYDGNKNKVGTLVDKIVNLNGEYFLEGYKDEIKLQGKFFSLQSTILKNGEPMAMIDRNVFAFDDAFAVEASEEDMPLVVALVIALDNIVDDKTRT